MMIVECLVSLILCVSLYTSSTQCYSSDMWQCLAILASMNPINETERVFCGYRLSEYSQS